MGQNKSYAPWTLENGTLLFLKLELVVKKREAKQTCSLKFVLEEM